MFDVDKLIELVKDEPCLWDKKLTIYSDRTCRDRAWVNIAGSFFEDWDQLNPKDKDQRVKDLKFKWKNVRDNYFKFVNQGKSGDPAPKRRKTFAYLDSLEFLQSVIEKRPTGGNFEEHTTQGDDDDEIEGLESQLTTDSETQLCVTKSVTPTPETNYAPKSCYKKRPKFTAFQSELLKIFDGPQNAKEDADKLFLLSLLPDLKLLNEEQKDDFKIMACQFFREAKRARRFSVGSPATLNSPCTSNSHPSSYSQIVYQRPSQNIQPQYPPHMMPSRSPHSQYPPQMQSTSPQPHYLTQMPSPSFQSQCPPKMPSTSTQSQYPPQSESPDPQPPQHPYENYPN